MHKWKKDKETKFKLVLKERRRIKEAPTRSLFQKHLYMNKKLKTQVALWLEVPEIRIQILPGAN